MCKIAENVLVAHYLNCPIIHLISHLISLKRCHEEMTHRYALR